MTAFVRNQPDSAWIAGYDPARADHTGITDTRWQ